MTPAGAAVRVTFSEGTLAAAVVMSAADAGATGDLLHECATEGRAANLKAAEAATQNGTGTPDPEPFPDPVEQGH